MADRTRRFHLCMNVVGHGFHAAAWRSPASDPQAVGGLAHYAEIVRLAEAGKFDAVFFPDKPLLAEQFPWRTSHLLEPTVLLGALAALSSHVGLIATASTSFSEPYNLARRFATLDILSGGRIGWNMVTTAEAEALSNFGRTEALSHAARYERASEFVEVVKALWDSWEEGAVSPDPAAGRFSDPSRIHDVDHAGTWFEVKGPLNLPRPPQGWPLLAQAGGSADGQAFAARHADMIFSVSPSLEAAAAYRQSVREQARRAGRDPESLTILPGLLTILGGTEAEARRRKAELDDLIIPEIGLSRIAGILQVEPERLELDKPLPKDLPPPGERNQSLHEAVTSIAARENLTVAALIRRMAGNVGHQVFVGAPEQAADLIEGWVEAGAADGFNILPDLLPSGAGAFVSEVVPILQRRGLHRRDYRETTLRERFGLVKPQNRFSPSRRSA